MKEYVYYCCELNKIDLCYIKCHSYFTDLNGLFGKYEFVLIGEL